jgi:adenosylhomocysteine nucleosidase
MGAADSNAERAHVSIAVLVSATTEWRAVESYYPDAVVHASPLGSWFVLPGDGTTASASVLFFHGGWGKIAAAASTQYVIDRWHPTTIINLGTCGGFAGQIDRGTVVLANRTLVYDILEQMGDPDEAVAHYTTEIALDWLGDDLPCPVERTLLVSADRDLVPTEIEYLETRYGAVAADWESGAIAYVAARNHVRCLILRGVSDVVGATGGEAYDGTMHAFTAGAATVMMELLRQLPVWITHVIDSVSLDRAVTD